MILKFFNAIQLFPFRLLMEGGGGGGSVYHVIQDQFSSVRMDEPEGYYCHFQRCRRTPSQSSQKCGIRVQSSQLCRFDNQSSQDCLSVQWGGDADESNAESSTELVSHQVIKMFCSTTVRRAETDSVQTPEEVKPTEKSLSPLCSKLSGAARWFSRKTQT